MRTGPAWIVGIFLALPVPSARAEEPPPRIPKRLTLDEAVAIALREQPTLRQARAQVGIAEAQRDQAAAPLFPQLKALGSYQRTTSNFVSRPGLFPSSVPGTPTLPKPSLNTSNFWNLDVGASLLLFDFGKSISHLRSAKQQTKAQRATARATTLQVLADVRTAYFRAWGTRALAEVARETLTNQLKHLDQVTAFVEAGTRPALDLAAQKTQVANARVALIRAENDYEVAKAQLNVAMGVEGSTDYEVAHQALGPVAGENAPLKTLVTEAVANRPELAAARHQIRAGEHSVSEARAGYFPEIRTNTHFTDAGPQLRNLTWNWNLMVNLSWTLFDGGLTHAQVRAAEFDVARLQAQAEATRLNVRLEVQQAQLSLRAAREATAAGQEALDNARALLGQAEGRYREGVGDIIELDDAQLAVTNAASQLVQAQYALAQARAELLRALGRPE